MYYNKLSFKHFTYNILILVRNSYFQIFELVSFDVKLSDWCSCHWNLIKSAFFGISWNNKFECKLVLSWYTWEVCSINYLENYLSINYLCLYCTRFNILNSLIFNFLKSILCGCLKLLIYVFNLLLLLILHLLCQIFCGFSINDVILNIFSLNILNWSSFGKVLCKYSFKFLYTYLIITILI